MCFGQLFYVTKVAIMHKKIESILSMPLKMHVALKTLHITTLQKKKKIFMFNFLSPLGCVSIFRGSKIKKNASFKPHLALHI